MKHLTSDEMVAKLIKIAEKSLANQGDDEHLFQCHHCLDTKFICRKETMKGYPGEFVTSKPCPYCTAGQQLLEARQSVEDRGQQTNVSERLNEFQQIFSRMCLQFGKKANRTLTAAYWEELQDYSTPELERGIKHAARKCKYMPRIADILDGINGPPI